MNWFITCTKRGYVIRMLLFLVNSVLKSQISSIRDITKIIKQISSRRITHHIFFGIVAGIALIKLQKVGPTLSQSVLILGVIFPILCNRRQETVSMLKNSLK